MVEKSRIELEKPKLVSNLNVYCLYAIFKEIKKNCELSTNKDRYRDLIHFAISNDYIRAVFLDWSVNMWEILEVRTACLVAYEFLGLNLAEIYEKTKTYTESEKQKFWDLLCTSLTENETLRCCFLNYLTTSYYPEHMETHQRITDILKKKQNLRKLCIQMPTYSPGNLENFRNLHSLELTSPMDAEALVACVKSNPSLRELSLLSTEIHGRLADIAPFCKNIRILNIQMKPHSNAIEYAPFTQLPELSHLGLGGNIETGSVGALFKSMAENGSRNLRTLLVDQPLESEVEELCKVQHLQEIVCELREPPWDLSPKHSWQWPVICARDLGMNSKNYEKDYIIVDILTSSGVLGLSSEDMIFIRKIQLRLNSWCQRRRRHSNSAPMWFEINDNEKTIENLRIQDTSYYKNITKIASFALLKAVENQWPTHARNINLLAGIRDLKELRVKVTLNIERELKRLKEFDLSCHVEEFEKEIPIDSDTLEIIYLAFLTYLSDTLARSKYTRIRSGLALSNFAMEINFDIRP